MKARWIGCALSAVIGLGTLSAQAKPHELRIPLHDGSLRLSDLSADVLSELHLPTTYELGGSIPMRGLGSSLLIRAMNHSLGNGCRLTVTANALILHFNGSDLPHNWRSTRKAIRTFTGDATPVATETQARQFQYGLMLPKKIDPSKPLVLLVHGFEMDRWDWRPMQKLLRRDGFAVALFNYPNDQPIAADAALFRKHMTALHEVFPTLKIDVIAFSMGGLVARDYIEGPHYTGGVDRFIMLAPPNKGSSWAPLGFALEIKEQTRLAFTDSKWSPTWPITDGLGEADNDLTPGSKLLAHLATLHRRAGVRYTIIEGDRQPERRILADWVDDARSLIPSDFLDVAPVASLDADLGDCSAAIRAPIDKADGPVKLTSADLPGVSDIVRVHADHQMLYKPDGPTPPASWEAIQARLEAK